jgi:hypothetical protein
MGIQFKGECPWFFFCFIQKMPENGLEEKMLWTVAVVVFILWLLGFSLHVGGGLIHLLLVVALVVVVINLVSGRRSVI